MFDESFWRRLASLAYPCDESSNSSKALVKFNSIINMSCAFSFSHHIFSIYLFLPTLPKTIFFTVTTQYLLTFQNQIILCFYQSFWLSNHHWLPHHHMSQVKPQWPQSHNFYIKASQTKRVTGSNKKDNESLRTLFFFKNILILSMYHFVIRP